MSVIPLVREQNILNDMFKNKKIYRMTEAEVNRMQLISPNKVLVKTIEKNIDKKTKSGIYLVSPTDTDWQPDRHVERFGIIINQVSSLVKKRNQLWKTVLETECGDLCWYDYLTGSNCDTIITETNEYKLLDYYDLIVAKRGEDIICLNGYCLFSLCRDEVKSVLAIDTGKYDARLGIMEYMGSCNGYYFDGIVDDDYLSIGDKCVFKLPPILLEDDYYACFNMKEKYRISQRYNVVAYYRDDVITPTVNHVLVEPEYDTHKGLIEIPDIYRKPNGCGRVEFSMIDGIHEGDRIKYFPSSCTTIEQEGKKYQIANAKDILVILK